MLVGNNGGAPLLLRNNAGEGNHWLGIKLQGTGCNRDAIGATITWSVNGKTRSLHSGRDFPVGRQNPVRAVAEGTVVLVADHFYTGNAVYIDHGGGLVSMYFHLDTTTVHEGDQVKRGERIGKVGATGRATGPHLHVGLRWQNKRIDPLPLFDPPSKLPSVSDTSAEAEAKIKRAQAKEPEEVDQPPED